MDKQVQVLYILIFGCDQRDRRNQPIVFDAVHGTPGWSEILDG